MRRNYAAAVKWNSDRERKSRKQHTHPHTNANRPNECYMCMWNAFTLFHIFGTKKNRAPFLFFFQAKTNDNVRRASHTHPIKTRQIPIKCVLHACVCSASWCVRYLLVTRSSCSCHQFAVCLFINFNWTWLRCWCSVFYNATKRQKPTTTTTINGTMPTK